MCCMFTVPVGSQQLPQLALQYPGKLWLLQAAGVLIMQWSSFTLTGCVLCQQLSADFGASAVVTIQSSRASSLVFCCVMLYLTALHAVLLSLLHTARTCCHAATVGANLNTNHSSNTSGHIGLDVHATVASHLCSELHLKSTLQGQHRAAFMSY
jgi:hypothetical protein